MGVNASIQDSSKEVPVLSWKDGKGSDCALVVEKRTYQVHRTIMTSGVRASCSLKEREEMVIKLDDLLPKECKTPLVFEAVLDFIYQGLLPTTLPELLNTKTTEMLKVAKILRIASLANEINKLCGMVCKTLEMTASLQVLASIDIENPCYEHVIDRVASCFDLAAETKNLQVKEKEEKDEKVVDEGWASVSNGVVNAERDWVGVSFLPVAHLRRVLASDMLQIPEQELCVYIAAVCQVRALVLDDQYRLWCSCRFPWISSDSLMRNTAIPSVFLLMAIYIWPGESTEFLMKLWKTRWPAEVEFAMTTLDISKWLTPRVPVKRIDNNGIQKFAVGMEVDAFCPRACRWFHAIILRRNVHPENVLVHFIGWGNLYDTWFPENSDWLQPHGLHTIIPIEYHCPLNRK